MRKAKFIFISVLLFLLVGGVVLAVGSDYEIGRWVTSGGGEQKTSEHYTVIDVTGQPGAGRSESGNFTLEAGFLTPIQLPVAATLIGHLSFPGVAEGRVMTVKFYDPGTQLEEVWSSLSGTTDASGNFTITTNLTAGTYDISVKNWTCLTEVELGIELVDGTTTYVNFGSSREGDSDDSDGVSIVDISILIAAYGTTPGDGDWNANCDYNRDSGVSITDISILIANYGDSGDPYPP